MKLFRIFARKGDPIVQKGDWMKLTSEGIEIYQAGNDFPIALFSIRYFISATQIEWEDEVRRLMKEDKKIHAIKFYRNLTKCSLKEAKETCESFVL